MDSCKFDGKVKSPFKTMMDAARECKTKSDVKTQNYASGPVQYDKKGRVKDPNILYWFRVPSGEMKPVYRGDKNV